MSGFHPATAASMLGIHSNSFAYRLERMREIADLSYIDAVASAPTLGALDYLLTSFKVMDG